VSRVAWADVTAYTHQGTVRAANEDTIAVGQWVRNRPMSRPERVRVWLDHPVTCLVADGMGGHEAGEVASECVAYRIVDSIAAVTDAEALSSILRAANDELFDRMLVDSSTHGMGSTVAGIVLQAEKAVVFNVGDSKLFQIQNGYLRQLSVDDVPDLAGVTLADGPNVRRVHTLTQALGGHHERIAVDPHVTDCPIGLGARYLICSDGLTDVVDLDRLETAMTLHDEEAVTTLYRLAIEAGSRDNISIIVIRVNDEHPTEDADDVR
jgi:PPM family protein phosphatase